MLTTEKKKLVEDHIKWVNLQVFRRKKTLPRRVEADDLLSVAYEGLCDAAVNYDQNKSSFATHAYSRIHGNMNDYLSKEVQRSAVSLDIMAEPYYCETTVDALFDKIIEPLSAKGKQIIRWYYHDNLAVEDIGNIIKRTVDQVHELIWYYRRQLKEKWRNRAEELLQEVG